jgi:hypothetical protein
MPKRRGAILDKAQLLAREKAIIADIKAGLLSYRQIAKKQKVSLPTVNNKARKAGISRGRRKGATILVASPPRAKKAAGRKPARKAARKAVRKTARKAARRVVRKSVPMVADRPVAMKPRKQARRKARVVRRVGRPAGKTKFIEAMRELVLRHHPKISLKAYDKLVKTLQAIG